MALVEEAKTLWRRALEAVMAVGRRGSAAALPGRALAVAEAQAEVGQGELALGGQTAQTEGQLVVGQAGDVGQPGFAFQLPANGLPAHGHVRIEALHLLDQLRR